MNWAEEIANGTAAIMVAKALQGMCSNYVYSRFPLEDLAPKTAPQSKVPEPMKYWDPQAIFGDDVLPYVITMDDGTRGIRFPNGATFSHIGGTAFDHPVETL